MTEQTLVDTDEISSLMEKNAALLDACKYTLGHLNDDKYINNDVLWSCVSHLVSAIARAEKP